MSKDDAVLEGGPLEMLFERTGVPMFGMPRALAASYGGDLGFAVPCLYANFVSSVDGVVALRDSGESGHIISGDDKSDRFVMGVLRACAAAILVGAGTFRKAPGHHWTAEAIDPPRAPLFAALRRQLGLAPRPPLVVFTASGEIDAAARALEGGFIFTTPEGASKLAGRAPESVRVVAAPSDSQTLTSALAVLRAEGLHAVLTEGGPSLVGQLVREHLLDEIFLTTSPALFGRADGDGRKGLIDGVDLGGAPLELLSVRRHGSHLFLRYALAKRADAAT